MSIYRYELMDIDGIVTFPPGSDHLFIARDFDGLIFLVDKDLDGELGSPFWEKQETGEWRGEVAYTARDDTDFLVDQNYGLAVRVAALGGTIDY
jgi:hypothetical protein